MWTTDKHGAVNLNLAEFIYTNGNTVVAHFPSGENRVIKTFETETEARTYTNILLMNLLREDIR